MRSCSACCFFSCAVTSSAGIHKTTSSATPAGTGSRRVFTYWVQDEAAVGVQPDLALIWVRFDALIEEVGIWIWKATVGGGARIG